MFISKADKQRIEVLLDKARNQIAILESKVTLLEKKLENPVQPKKKYKKKPLTAAQKARQREYQKAYNARKKAQLTEVNTNVSA